MTQKVAKLKMAHTKLLLLPAEDSHAFPETHRFGLPETLQRIDIEKYEEREIKIFIYIYIFNLHKNKKKSGNGKKSFPPLLTSILFFYFCLLLTVWIHLIYYWPNSCDKTKYLFVSVCL